jgi:phage terminase large subunit GpA-like protein
MQYLEWGGLKWADDFSRAWYVCQENGCCIDEHHKTDMIAQHVWIPSNPSPEPGVRSYTANCLYYQFGLGPTWAELARMWVHAQNDPARLKTFVNDRLAETWEDTSMRAVRHNAIAERAEPYALRDAPVGVLYVTAGVDTQDNRLELTLTGWGRGMAFWILDHHVLPGDPADPATFAAATEYLNKPVQRQDGVVLRVEATAQDMGGHRTEDVKHWVRQQLVRRPMAIQGAIQNNAPVLGKPRMLDVTYKGVTDKKGVRVYYVGTVAAKNWLFGRLSVDAERAAEDRMTHFSHELEPSYFAGLVSETYNPAKNRYEKKRGARNEPLDTFVYSYAAAHHPELRLHRMRAIDWDNREKQLLAQIKPAGDGGQELPPTAPAPQPVAKPNPQQTMQRQRQRAQQARRMGW